jgi:hypothetical protein
MRREDGYCIGFGGTKGVVVRLWSFVASPLIVNGFRVREAVHVTCGTLRHVMHIIYHNIIPIKTRPHRGLLLKPMLSVLGLSVFQPSV